MTYSKIHENWQDLKLFLPKGWTTKARQLGALERKRGVASANALLRILLIHLIDGCSLKETVTRAKHGGICNISHVALSKRLKKSGEWFHWMSLKLLNYKNKNATIPPSWVKEFHVKIVDASVICEPGSTGTDWRLHYSITLFDLKADQFYLTNPKVGETFTNFKIQPGELWIADRAYCAYSQLKHVLERGADFVVRWKVRGLTLTQNGKQFNPLQELKKLQPGQIGHWNLEGSQAQTKNSSLKLRLCAIAKSKKQAEKAMRDYKKQAKKKGKNYSEETLELQRYIIVLTSLPERITASQVMNLYRARWQIELSFKRMKSLMKMGQLPKKDPEVSIAWLQGKMFVALLIQTILEEGRFFSPWGYPLSKL